MRPPKRRRPPVRPGEHLIPPSGTPAVIGVCWYRQDQYDRFLASANDREALEDTWSDWQITAERIIRQYRVRGLDVGAESKPNTAATRAAYVTHLLERQEGSPA